MTSGPLVSIILPVYNGERYIGSTLDSALGQTYRNIEIILVNDGSRDGTPAIVERRAVDDSRIRVIHQTNRGVAAARNRALAEARGEFVAPLDADDLWDPAKIARQVARMIEAGKNTGLIYTWWVWIDATGAVLDCSPRWRIEGDASDTLLKVNYTGNASVPLYRRRWLEQVGGYDETMRERDAHGCEDWDVALKVAEQSRVAVVPSLLVGYRRCRHSMSARTDRMWRGHSLVVNAARHRRAGLSEAVVQQSRDQFALHLAGVCFWSAAYPRAIGWGLRALRSGFALRILPYVVRLLSETLFRNPRAARPVRPGVLFSDIGLLQPRIPYDVLYDRLKRQRLN
jgi:glycosyltransferase involved in cell wall biosynthesis